MASLYDVTEGTKNIFKWGTITVVAIFTLIFLFRGGKFIKELIAPTPPPPPTVAYGKLPEVQFPPSIVADQKLSYEINTVSGTLDAFPSDRIKVYKMAVPEPTLLSFRKTQEQLASVGFVDTPVSLSETIYQWQETEPPIRRIQYDTLTSNFVLSSSFLTDDTVLARTNMPTEAEAIPTTTNFLTQIGSLPTDLDTDKTKVTLLGINNGTTFEATSYSTAQVIRVDYFQKNVNNLPIFYPHPPFSTMTLFVAGGELSGGTVVSGTFTHFSITNNSATYPIYTTEQAFSMLKEGKAYIASYSGAGNTVHINDVLLGYYLQDTPTKYLMPIIIFEGSDNFVAYLPAVTAQWVGK